MKPLVDFLRAGKTLRVLSHVDPDGDALGSSLGLAWILASAGKSVRVHLAAPVPRMYRFLPAGEFLAIGAEAPGRAAVEGPDSLVVLDSTAPSRLGALQGLVTSGVPVLNLDHHADNTRFGDATLVDPTAAATALLVVELARAAAFEIPAPAATCLYTGLLTDTGRFTFGNTNERALRAAADLVGLGADPAHVASSVYEGRPASALRLLGRALETLELREDGRVACLHVTTRMLAETGALPEETEGFASHARSIEGVQVGIFLRETDDGAVKASFRSTGGVPIDGVANQFGGGGHPAASGARLPGPLETAKERVLRAVGEHLQARA